MENDNNVKPLSNKRCGRCKRHKSMQQLIRQQKAVKYRRAAGIL